MFCPSCGKELPEGSKFCLDCGKPIGATSPTLEKKSRRPTLRAIGIGLLILLLVGLFWLTTELTNKTSTPAFNPPARTPVLVPMSTKLFTGQLVIKAGHYVTRTFAVEPGMQNFRVIGDFNASGGSGNDIQAVLADEDEFQNWINGHQARVFYSTDKITNGKLDVGPLAPGRYVLAFNNTFSTFSDKYVFAEVEANWAVQK